MPCEVSTNINCVSHQFDSARIRNYNILYKKPELSQIHSSNPVKIFKKNLILLLPFVSTRWRHHQTTNSVEVILGAGESAIICQGAISSGKHYSLSCSYLITNIKKCRHCGEQNTSNNHNNSLKADSTVKKQQLTMLQCRSVCFCVFNLRFNSLS